MKKFTKYFKQIDFFGSAPELLIHNSSTFKTNVGAIFTMLSLGIICYYLVRSIAKLLDTTSPQVDTLEFFDMAKLKLEISGSTVLPAITVSEPVNGFLLTVDEIQSLATIKGELRRYRYDYVANKVNYFSTFIDIVDCYKLKNTKPYTWMYSDVISGTKGKSLCFDLPTDSEWEIFGDRLYGDMNVLRLSMFPCSSNNCIPPDKVANHMFYLIKHQQYVQFSDYKDPIKKLSVLRENLNINPAAGTAIFNFYNRVNVYDTVSSLVDSNFVGTYLNPVKEEVNSYFRNSSQTKCTEAEITNMSCLAYMSLELRSSGFEVTYTRNYPDILNSFSDVGGFKELVVICVTILYSWVNDWLKGNYIIEEIMPLDSIKQLIKESIRLEESLEEKGGMVSAGDHNSPPPGGLPDKTIQTFMSTNLESVGQQTTNPWKLGHQKDQPSAGNENFKKVMPKNRESSHRLAEIPSNSTQMQIVVPITTTAENGSSNDQENPQPKQAAMDPNVARKKEFGYERLQRCVGNIKTIQSVAQAGRKKTEQKANPLIKLAAAFLNKEYSECIYFEEIKSMVEDLSNITLMIREINSWRAIKEILFLPHHFKLMPLVEIELEARRKKQATNVENTLKFPASMSRILLLQVVKECFVEGTPWRLSSRERTFLVLWPRASR